MDEHFRRGRLSRCARVALGAGVVGTFAVSGLGQTLSWNNPGGGVASLASNWSPAQTPTASSDLLFNLNGSYAVVLNSFTPASRGITLRRGVVQLNLAETHNAGVGGLTVGDLAGDIASTNIGFGRLNLGGVTTIGDAAGSTGTLVIDDDAELSVVTSSLLRIGNGGTGTLRLLNGGVIRTPDEILVGSLLNSSGVLEVSGRDVQSPFGFATLEVNGPALSRIGVGGSAQVTVSQGGRALFAGPVAVATNAASNASVTISGSVLGNPATLDTAADLTLARNTQAGLGGGTGLIDVGSGGQLNVAGLLDIGGDPDGGVGTLRLQTGGLITTRSLRLGGTGAVTDLRGGVLTVDGGTFERIGAGQPFAYGGPGAPSIALINGATATLPAVPNIVINIGSGPGSSPASFAILSGSVVHAPEGNFNIGFGADDPGILFVQDAGSTLDALPGGILNVGAFAQGDLVVEDGGQVLADEVNIGIPSNVLSSVILSDTGSRLEAKDIFIGGSSSAAGGSGLLQVSNGATLVANDGFALVRVWPTGVLQFTNATGLLRTTTLLGDCDLRSSSITGTQFLVQSDGVLSGSEGTSSVDALVRARDRSIVEARGGNLIIGRASAADTFVADGDSLVRVTDGARMTILSSNGTRIINAELRGGTLESLSGFRRVLGSDDDHVIAGFGTVIGDLTDYILHPQLDGIRVRGVFTAISSNAVVDGSRIVMESGSVLRGSGDVDARVELEPGARIEAVTLDENSDGSSLIVGDGLRPDGVIINGSISTSSSLRLRDSDGVTLGPSTELLIGSVTCSQPLTIPTSGVVSGAGSFRSPEVRVAGRLSPNPVVADRFGFIAVQLGELILQPEAVVELDLDPAQGHDRIIVDEAITLGGRLVVRGAPPTGSAPVVIMESLDRVTGEFQSVDLPPGLRLRREPTRIIIEGGCTADFNSDSSVNSQDFFDFLTALFASDADINGDGNTNSQDFFDFILVFFNGC